MNLLFHLGGSFNSEAKFGVVAAELPDGSSSYAPWCQGRGHFLPLGETAKSLSEALCLPGNVETACEGLGKLISKMKVRSQFLYFNGGLV